MEVRVECTSHQAVYFHILRELLLTWLVKATIIRSFQLLITTFLFPNRLLIVLVNGDLITRLARSSADS